MAVDMTKIGAELKRVPWWGWAAGGGAVLAGVYYVRKQGQASSAAQQVSSSTVPAGLNAADLAGIPFDYTDYNGTPTPDPNPTPIPVDPTPPSGPGTPSTQTATTRGPESQFAFWDNVHHGIPLDTAGMGQLAGDVIVPFSSPLEITGPAQSGPTNWGTNQWYPATYNGASGFVSAVDLTAPPSTPAASGGTGGGGGDAGAEIGRSYGLTWPGMLASGGHTDPGALVDTLTCEPGQYGDEYSWLFPGDAMVSVP